MEHIKINGIIFDYGGTIDSRGEHWSEVIWRGYLECGVPVSKEQFRDAYVFAERELAKTRHILPHHTFRDLREIKMKLEMDNLVDTGALDRATADAKYLPVAHFCYNEAKACIAEAIPVLDALAARYPMVLVSNFYGNVESVLDDFGLRHYFKQIIESAVVGVRKPDPQIFRLGVEALGLPAADVLVIGDSYKKDIVPAESIGCHVLWLKGKGWTAEEDAVSHPAIIKKLADVLDVAL